ncbi:hypothetical protein [Legionella micdadei]|uniref:Substrate of the Dot/Icm secretion system n=1 Tax=Legionella micdadei TaxID=451 RepID=A0A098GD58_LEGMI|nr:hypothetical protein [Legionella micdadei]ARG97955.1 hypothetical protein B6N58_09965 [Legionella micdadei]ARG99725.1 hypothetical protein B6V88_04445 [Legionella micdadei]KTD28683.1 substrate of the Dot/Icm secretion system [Legionella micdadei]NSL19339.1 hypothetical protein [Legionella micdadei]CEG60423.1 protein of unknown function [Legionella micdadei]
MSYDKRDEELRKQKALEEEAAKKKAQEEQEAQRLVEEEKKRAIEAKAAQEEEEAKKKSPETEKTPEHIAYRVFEHLDEKTKKEWKKDTDDLIGDYKKQFPDREIDAKGTLVFHSQEEMMKFFTDQAQQGRKFLCAEVDASGKPTGQYQFSCGDGKLYSGSLEQIQAAMMKNQSTASPENQKLLSAGLTMIDKLLNPKPNPTQDIKERLKASQSGATPPKKEEVSESQPTAPNPLSTVPRL